MNESRATSAQRLTELADDPRYEGRADDLRSLSQALGDEANTTWTGIDLISAFPAEATLSIGHRQILERLLGVLAGVSVFLPVGWTWFSLHSATQAYNKLLSAGEENGRTFLAMWTQGFDGRLEGSHRLVPMALVSFGLVLFAVACIVLHRLASEVNVHREDNVARQAHRDLVTGLLQAQRFLNERRSDDPRFLEAAVERSVVELNKAHMETRKGITAMNSATQKGVDQINEASTQLTDNMMPLLVAATTAGTNLAASAASAAEAEKRIASFVAEVSAGLDAAMTQFATTVSTNTTQLSTNTAQLTTETATVMSQLTEKVDQIAKAQESLTQELVTRGEASLAAAGEAAEVTRRASAALAETNQAAAAEAADVTRRATAALAEASRASISELSENSKASLAELASVIRDLQHLLVSHDGALQAQASELSRAADLSSQILSEMRSHSPQPDGAR